MRKRKQVAYALFVLTASSILFIITLSFSTPNTSSINNKDHRDYSILKRSNFDDILEKDRLWPSAHQDKKSKWLEDVEDQVHTISESMRIEKAVPPRVIRDSIRAKMRIVQPNEDINTEMSFVNCSNIFNRDSFVRNCITGHIVGKIPEISKLTGFSYASNEHQQIETSHQRKGSFVNVYKHKAWGASWDPAYKEINGSGRGATLLWAQEITATIHNVLNQVKAEHGLQTVRLLDVPCGDLAWMNRLLQTRDDIHYTGVDIVPQLIQHHRDTYKQTLPNAKFLEGDILNMDIWGRYDVILCRALLQHLSFDDVLHILQKVSQSGAKVLIATTFPGISENRELKIGKDNPGRFRKLNLEIPPISLSPPACVQRDGPPDDFEGWDHFAASWQLPLNSAATCQHAQGHVLRGTDRMFYSCMPWSDNVKDMFD